MLWLFIQTYLSCEGPHPHVSLINFYAFLLLNKTKINLVPTSTKDLPEQLRGQKGPYLHFSTQEETPSPSIPPVLVPHSRPSSCSCNQLDLMLSLWPTSCLDPRALPSGWAFPPWASSLATAALRASRDCLVCVCAVCSLNTPTWKQTNKLTGLCIQNT